MPRKKIFPAAPMGRTLKNIDWEVVDRLLEAGCCGTEIAAHFGICKDTLYDRTKIEHGVTFSSYQQEKKMRGDSLLRSKQFQLAMSGEKTMLIWLGKQRLGQTDKMDQTNTTPVYHIVNYTDRPAEQWEAKNTTPHKILPENEAVVNMKLDDNHQKGDPCP